MQTLFFRNFPVLPGKSPVFQIVLDLGAKSTNNKTSPHQMAFTLTLQRGFIVFVEEAPAITASPMMAGGKEKGRNYSRRDLTAETIAIARAPAVRTPEPMVKAVRSVDHHGVMEMMSPATMFAE